MFIQTEETPNPNTLKFIPGRDVFKPEYSGYASSYTKEDDLENCLLAKNLLAIHGVRSVFLGSDFISVGKEHEQDWYVLKPHILGALLQHFVNDLPVIRVSEKHTHKEEEAQDDVSQKICDILNTRVRPAVAQDGGDIVFHSFEDGIVYLQMKGACSGCPSSSATLKNGIENMLKFYVPQVKEVKQVEDY